MTVEAISDALIGMFGRYFFGKRAEFPDTAPSFRTPPHFGWADSWLEDLTRWFLSIPKNLTVPDAAQRIQMREKCLSQHRAIVLEMAEKIREKKAYSFFLDVIRAVEKRFEFPPFPLWVEEVKGEARPTISSFLMTELLLLWVLMAKKGRFLVCVQGGHQRKEFLLPENLEDRKRAILEIGQQVLVLLPFMTPEHLHLVPSGFGPIHDIDTPVKIPICDQSIEEILADARARQCYIIHPQGVPVQWQKRGRDLQEMFIKTIGRVVIAKVTTSRGETIALLDLDNAKGIDFAISREGLRLGKEAPLALNLASAYHDLVTRKIKVGRRKKLSIGTVKAPEAEEETVLVKEESPVIYIPRTVVIGGKVREVFPQLRSSHKSPNPHLRHLKYGRMSERQRSLIEEYERKNKVDILAIVQPGCTYVLPHGETRKAVYIKSRVESDLSPELMRAG